MTDDTTHTSLRNAAVVAGVALLLMAVAAVVATDVTIGTLVVPGDAADTFDNVRASQMRFRTGLFSWLVVLVCDVVAAWGLYVFLKPVNENLSLLMAWFRMVYAVILGAALVNLVAVVPLVSRDAHLAVFGRDELGARVQLYLNMFEDTWSLGLAVFGFHIFVLGYLVLKSRYIPGIFGVLLLVAFGGYLITSTANLLMPTYPDFEVVIGWIFLVPMVIGELGLGLWLLFRGARDRSR
ncbi:MAG: DUF4386 domain-containing protein [bacterium]|nr:DUF4386 domain-containing protein [bacterium]